MTTIRTIFTIALLFSPDAMLMANEQAPVDAPSSTMPPILQIDSGGHNAIIKDVAFTPDGQYLLSASDDKLIRVWDIKTGRTVRTQRGQIDLGDEGKIYAMTLSPNGQWLAAGGWTSNDEIRLYDFPSGKLVALLEGHTDVVHSLRGCFGKK